MSFTTEELHSTYLWRLKFEPFRHSALFSDDHWRAIGRWMMHYARQQGWA